MAFRVPSMPLIMNVWRTNGIGGVYAAPNLSIPCGLSVGRRELLAVVGTISREFFVSARSDVRPTYNAVAPDLIEVPAGSKRFYSVMDVEDVGRPFLNEYRLVLASYLSQGTAAFGGFAAPVPLP